MKLVIDGETENLNILTLLKRRLGFSTALVTALKNREDGIILNGERVTVRKILTFGDILELATDFDVKENVGLVPMELPLDIIFEDDSLMVINKPPYMPTHPSHGHFSDSLANALAYYFKKQGKSFVFRAVSRLDRNTSGAVLIAKNKLAASRLSASHQAGLIKKTYLALLDGALCGEGEIKNRIKRSGDSIITREICKDNEEGSFAHTRYSALAAADITAVKAEPITGRTHQLRVHFQGIGHPICGDELYGGSDILPRHALHAYKLEFPHPISGESLCFTAPIPKDMQKTINERLDLEIWTTIAKI